MASLSPPTSPIQTAAVVPTTIATATPVPPTNPERNTMLEIHGRLQYNLTASQMGVHLPEFVVSHMVRKGTIYSFINTLLQAKNESSNDNEEIEDEDDETDSEDEDSECDDGNRAVEKKPKISHRDASTQTSLEPIYIFAKNFRIIKININCKFIQS